MGKNYQHGSIQYTVHVYRKLRCALASARENVERFWGIILSGPDKP